MNASTWYKDAVIYQVHVRSFADSNRDGIGDFPGLTEKLDYIVNLGVTAVWLLPFYPSPLRDDGYDIADYRNIHPDYGTIADFLRFLKTAHAKGLKVITELFSTTLRTSMPGSNAPAAPNPAASGAIIMCGMTMTKNMRRPGSFSKTLKLPTGTGIPPRKPTTGIVFTGTNPT